MATAGVYACAEVYWKKCPLVALPDGLTALLPFIAILRLSRVLLYTDYMQAVRALPRSHRKISYGRL